MFNDYKNLGELFSFEQSKKLKNIFDLKLIKIKQLQVFDSVEVTFFLYPYNREMDADSFNVLPYEEYVNDLNQGSRSIYEKIDEYGDKVFGILLGIVIALVFLVVKPSDFISIQSIISILGAYTIGKEIWSDLNNFFIRITSNWVLKWKDIQYFYTKQDFGTIQRFWRIARNSRYGNSMILPTKFDLINQSNTKMIELMYDKVDLSLILEDELQVGTLEFLETDLAKLNSDGFMLGLKLSLTKKTWFVRSSTEFFQAKSKGNLGTTNNSGEWVADQTLVKKVFALGSLKYYRSSSLFKDLNLFHQVNVA